MQAARPVLNGGDEETGLLRPRLVATQLRCSRFRARLMPGVGISRRFVYKWAQRFLQHGIEGLADKPGRGYRPVSRQ